MILLFWSKTGWKALKMLMSFLSKAGSGAAGRYEVGEIFLCAEKQ